VTVDQDRFEEWAARAELCRRDLRAFMRETWPLVEPRPFVDSWHIGAICERLEAVTRGEIRRLIINVPPRSTKSLTAAVMWPAWEWLSSPEVRWVYASYADTLATKHSVVCRRLIESRGMDTASENVAWIKRVGYRGLLELLRDDWELAGDQNLKTKFENDRTGYRVATSVGGTVTGDGGDRLVVDDPLKAEDASSETKRKGANEWFDQTWSTRLNDPVRSTQVVIMQRLHEQDLTGHLLGRGDWEHLCLPGQFEPSHPFVWPDDPRTVEGESLDPERFPPSRLAELKRDLGAYGFAGQIQQRPSPAEGGLFRRDWWQRWTPDSLPREFHRVIASWDMAFKDEKGSSFVVGQIWGLRDADRFLLGQVRARMDFVATCDAVVALAEWRPEARQKLVEDKANGPAVISALGRKVSGLTPIQPEGGKEARAHAVSPVVQSGNVFLPAGAFIPCPPGYEATSVADFIEEHAGFPTAAHNDQVDATTQALNWLEDFKEPGPPASTYCHPWGKSGPIFGSGRPGPFGSRGSGTTPGGIPLQRGSGRAWSSGRGSTIDLRRQPHNNGRTGRPR
jgi:predicted phage terminase large subunit-like protein